MFKYAVLDIECYGLDFREADIYMCGALLMPERKYYCFTKRQRLDDLLYHRRIVGSNIKFDIKALVYHKWLGKDFVQSLYFEPVLEDIQVLFNLAGWYGTKEDYSLKRLAPLFGYPYPNWNRLFHVGYEDAVEIQRDLSQIDLYNRHDLLATNFLYQKFNSETTLAEQVSPRLRRLLSYYLGCLVELEDAGFQIDVAFLLRMRREVEKRINDVHKKLYRFGKINWRSHKEIGGFFEKRLPKSFLETLPQGKTGASYNEFALKQIAKGNGVCAEVAKLLLDLREYEKIHSTYCQGILNVLRKDMYYPDYSLLTDTGRVSEHFAQVLPKSELRRMVISRFKGGKLLAVDYSQLELRLIALESGDPLLTKELNSRFDLHADTLKRFPVLENRTKAKNVNFGVFYGAGVRKIMELGLTESEARDIIKDRRDKYKGITEWHRKLNSGEPFVRNRFGRIRFTDKYTERINSPIQSAGADMNKMMVVELSRALQYKASRVILDKHDEIVIDVCPKEEKAVISIVKELYKPQKIKDLLWYWFGIKSPVKFEGEIKIGENLWDMEEIK